MRCDAGAGRSLSMHLQLSILFCLCSGLKLHLLLETRLEAAHHQGKETDARLLQENVAARLPVETLGLVRSFGRGVLARLGVYLHHCWAGEPVDYLLDEGTGRR